MQIQRVRIALGNRLSRAQVDPLLFSNQIGAVRAAEAIAKKDLNGEFKAVVAKEIIEWQQNSAGIGEHLLARLLGEIGDPKTAIPMWWEGTGKDRKLMIGEPYQRTPRQLFAYCGVGDPERKRKKGMTAEEAEALGRPTAKMIVRLLAESCIKQVVKPLEDGDYVNQVQYRAVYDKERARYNTREGWTDARKHNAALRRVGRAILYDLWLVANGKKAGYTASGSVTYCNRRQPSPLRTGGTPVENR